MSAPQPSPVSRSKGQPSTSSSSAPSISAEMLQDALAGICNLVTKKWLPAAKITDGKTEKKPKSISGDSLIVANLDGKIPGALVMQTDSGSIRRLGLALARSPSAKPFSPDEGKKTPDPQTAVFGFMKDMADATALRFDSRGSYSAILPVLFHGQPMQMPWPYKRGVMQNFTINKIEITLVLGIRPPKSESASGGERRSIIAKLKRELEG